MKRDEAVSKLRAARKELVESLAGVSPEDLVRPNAIEKWSIKDLLSHIASWDEETLRVIQAFAMQTEPRYTYTISDRNDFAAWNAEQIAARSQQSYEQARSEFENARRDLIQIIEGVTDQVLMRSKATSWDTVQTGLELVDVAAAHDLEHAKDVRSWRKKRERWARARQKYVSKRRDVRKKTEEPEENSER